MTLLFEFGCNSNVVQSTDHVFKVLFGFTGHLLKGHLTMLTSSEVSSWCKIKSMVK